MRYVTVGIDPGKIKGLAYALVETTSKRLLFCGVAHADTIDEQARELSRIASVFVSPLDMHVVAEIPIWHRPKPSDPRFINPNDLIMLAASAGIAVGALSAQGATSEYVLANVWKGQRPKDVHNRYVRKLLSAQEDTLLNSVPKKLLGDVLDAIGIAFWKVVRR